MTLSGSFVRLAVVAALALRPAFAHAQLDVIRGKVTDIAGAPIPSVRITATSLPGGVTRETKSDNKGNFQLAFQNGEGDYLMAMSVIGFVYKQFEIKRTADQDFLLADAKLSPVMLDTLKVTASAPQQRVDRGVSVPDVSGTDRTVAPAALPPDQLGSIAALAATVAGVLLVPGVDGAADGFSVLGMGADQNSVTLNGMSFDRSSLPRDASYSGSLVTSSADVSRGGFSGGQLNLRTATSTTYATRGMNMVLNMPQLMWTDRAGRSLGSEYTNISIGGRMAGPVGGYAATTSSANSRYYDLTYQIGRRSNTLQTLLNTDVLGLHAQGIAKDSVGRLMDILGGAGIASNAAGVGDSRYSDQASALATYNYAPFASTSSQSFNGTVSANWSRQHPIGGGVTALPSYAGNRTNVSGAVQGGHSGYFGMVLSESQVGANVSQNYGTPYLELPSGRVRVTSTFEEGPEGVSSLAFGGYPSASAKSTTFSASFNNALSWFSDDNKHRLKFSTELAYDHSAQDQSSNLLGSFTFNSLADLENGAPASFSRQLTARVRRTGGIGAAFSLGDTYRRSPDLQIQYGVRVEGTHFEGRPGYNRLVDSVFGARNDAVPQHWYVSPRVTFSYTLGSAQQIAAFDGAFRGPRAVIRGGLGVYQNRLSSGTITSALENTGLPDGVQQLVCTGPAAPVPQWDAYTDPTTIPSSCRDGTGGSVFASTSPNVSLFAPDFASQRRVSGNVGWTGMFLKNRFNLSVDATGALLLGQQRTVDLNFRDQQAFTLADEGGRPVFVGLSSIDPATGAIASRDARVSTAFNRVQQTRSDLRGTTGQLTLSLSPYYTTSRRFTWNGSYTFALTRDQVSGFSSTVGNPLDVEWASSGAPLHRINYNFAFRMPGYFSLSWNGSFQSGRSFTPLIAGDVNGDGSSNDRAFVFDPAHTNDAALGTAMQTLLANASPRAKDCLVEQLGRFAARNSCGGPWTSSASLNLSLDPARTHMPRRARVTFNLSNPLGAADLAFNGSGGLKGWGQAPAPDQTLLYVRGFDATAQRFRYDVNQRFGVTRPAFTTLRSPVTLTMTIRMDLGPAREVQSLSRYLSYGRTAPGSKYAASTLRSVVGTTGLTNPLLTIIAQQDLLQLTVDQSDSLASMSRNYQYRADSLMMPAMTQLADLPVRFQMNEAEATWLRARIALVAMLQEMAPAVNALLTPEQRRKLPQTTLNMLDPQYLRAIQQGTLIYVGVVR